MVEKSDKIVELSTQLNEQRRKVDFDSFDITVKELINMVSESLIDIAPEYQRQFRWSESTQSTFIESVFLGIPIPSLFMAANPDGTWELIDGVQRLSTLIHFAGDEKGKEKISKQTPLTLMELSKLSAFNNKNFNNLPKPIQLQFLLKPLKVTTISDKSDKLVRFDLFERLNTGGVALTPQEIRNCIYRGEFTRSLQQFAKNKHFYKIVKLPKQSEKNGTREEFVLRFFAYFYNYTNFKHSVIEFLNSYMETACNHFNLEDNQRLFTSVFSELAKIFPNGIKRARDRTPVNLFEAVSVGAALAYREIGKIDGSNADKWMNSEQLKYFTEKATNTLPMVKGRIEFCRDRFKGIPC